MSFAKKCKRTEISDLVQAVKAYEELATSARTKGSYRPALLALLPHPLINSFHAVLVFGGATLKANQEYLPQFFSGG